MALSLAAAYVAEPVYREVFADDDGDDDACDRLVMERRYDARTRLARPIRVIELTGGKHIAGRCRDIGRGGLRIEIPLNNAIRIGEVIQIDVGTLSGVGPLAGRPRVIPSRVVWIARETKMLRPLQTAGVEFAIDEDALVNVA